MRLKPVDFCKAHCVIVQTDSSNPFQFPPTTWAVPLPQKGEYLNATTRGYRLNIGDLTDDFKPHWIIACVVMIRKPLGSHLYGGLALQTAIAC